MKKSLLGLVAALLSTAAFGGPEPPVAGQFGTGTTSTANTVEPAIATVRYDNVIATPTFP